MWFPVYIEHTVYTLASGIPKHIGSRTYKTRAGLHAGRLAMLRYHFANASVWHADVESGEWVERVNGAVVARFYRSRCGPVNGSLWVQRTNVS